MTKRAKTKQPVTEQRTARDWWGKIVGGGVLLILIALCGLYLQWYYGARRLEVKLVLGRVTLEGGSQYRDGLHLIAVNHGNVPVQVVSAGIYLPDGAPYPEDSPYNAYPERGDDFSLPIKPGNNKAVTLQGLKLRAFCDSLVNAEHNSTVSLVGFYEDGTLKVHKSDSFHFNIEDAMKLARSQSDAAESPDSDIASNNQ